MNSSREAVRGRKEEGWRWKLREWQHLRERRGEGEKQEKKEEREESKW